MARSTREGEREWSRNWQIFGLLVGPVAYSTFFVAGYLLVETACQTGILMRRFFGFPLAIFLVVVLGLGTAGLIATGGRRAYRAWEARQDRDLVAEGRQEFMALAALTLTALFGLSTIITALSVAVREPCRWV